MYINTEMGWQSVAPKNVLIGGDILLETPKNHIVCLVTQKSKTRVQNSTIVSQLDKCLKFKSIQDNKNDYRLYKITPEMPSILDIYSVVTL